MATKNAAKHVESTIRSVISQNYDDVELIVIDSVSSDNTMEIVNKYSQKYSIVSICEPDNGISDAFNKGIAISTGDWIIFMGAGDTFINPNVLEYAARRLSRMSKYLVVWGNTLIINEKMNIQYRANGSISKFKLRRYMCLPHQSTFHNKILYETYGLYDSRYRVAMDYELLIRAIDDVKMEGYVDFDVSFVLAGGVSEQSTHALNEFRLIQKKYRVWRPVVISDILYFWGVAKHILATIISRILKKCN